LTESHTIYFRHSGFDEEYEADQDHTCIGNTTEDIMSHELTLGKGNGPSSIFVLLANQ